MRNACLFWKYKKNPIEILSLNLIKMYPKTTTHEIIAIRFSFRKKLVKINDKFGAIEINADYIIDYIECIDYIDYIDCIEHNSGLTMWSVLEFQYYSGHWLRLLILKNNYICIYIFFFTIWSVRGLLRSIIEKQIIIA